MKYIIKKDYGNETSADVILEDGGVVSFHHNGENICSTYYQDRIEKPFDEIDWDKLAEGKVYMKDWEGEDKITREMIMDALNWLAPFQNSFTKIELD